MTFLRHRKWQWAIIFSYSYILLYVLRAYLVPLSGLTENGHLAGDPLVYSNLAHELASKLRIEGVDAWQLHYQGQGPAGIMALVYLINDSQALLITLNAALHATASLSLIQILKRFFSPTISVISAMPFVISPFQMYWFSQINKDSYVTCGFMVATLALCGALEKIKHPVRKRDIIHFVALSGIGALLIHIGRPYVVLMFQVFGIICILIAVVLVACKPISRLQRVRAIMFGGICCLALLCLKPLTHGAASDQTISALASAQSTSTGSTAYPAVDTCLDKTLIGWQPTWISSSQADILLQALFTQRCWHFTLLNDVNPNTRHAVLDAQIFPNSAIEAMIYLPKATVNALFAPYPWHAWPYFGISKSAFFTVTPFETGLLLITLPFLVCWLFRQWRSKLSAVALIALSASIVVTYGMAIPFIGALYRYRYPYWMLILGFSIAAALAFFQSRRNRKSAVCL
jgi:hypothetical protein